jgi:kynurenine formamidase
VLVDLRRTPPGTPVGPDVLASVGERLQPGAAVLLVTGWDRHWGESGYLDHPGYAGPSPASDGGYAGRSPASDGGYAGAQPRVSRG